MYSMYSMQTPTPPLPAVPLSVPPVPPLPPHKIYHKPGDDPVPNPNGYGANDCDDALIPDTVTNAANIREVYESTGDMVGPFTTPLLWDNKEKKIVSNESTEILRIFNSAFNDIAGNPGLDLYPAAHADTMVELNDRLVYPCVNNGVYRCGFARSQESYEQAVGELYGALDELDARLGKTRFLSGDDAFTWLDLRLFQTLVRFDPVYTCYFKCTLRRIADYPNLVAFMRDVHSCEPIRRALNMKHIKTHYYTSHPHLNTFGIIPVGDGADLTVPAARGPPLQDINVMAKDDAGESKT